MKLFLSFFALFVFVLLAACQPASPEKADPNVDYYTCAMHPSVHAKTPGECPICGMTLIPVMKKPAAAAEASSQPSSFTVPVERQQQIGVTYAVAKTQPLRHTLRTVGMIVPDKTRQWEFVSRVEGYVQKLGVTSPGESVLKDQPLLTIYSPDLLIAEHEFVTLLESRDRVASSGAKESATVDIQGGRLRLQRWNLTPRQIAELEKTRQPSETLTLYSPFAGVVSDVPVGQGQKVSPGDRLVDVADLSSVWVWAEFYENELPMLRNQQAVTITTASYPGRKFEGRIGLINPFLNEATRTSKVRIDIANADMALRPGMYANLTFVMDMGEGLTIPVNAVMPTGGQSLVFVDRHAGKLEPRLVQLEGKFGEFYAVREGLKDGDRVVSSANFLIDAEAKLQGAVKSFEEVKP